jgi:hypothetical protein
MKQLFFAVAVAVAVTACGPVPDRVFFEEPSKKNLTGVWSGTEEITTDDDITSNVNFPGTTQGGFDFPVVINFGTDGRFTLHTANFPTSYQYDEDRTCSGVYTHTNSTVQFFPSSLCRALPMTKFTLGRTLPSGISLEARTNTSGSAMASYASVHVRIFLDPQ